MCVCVWFLLSCFINVPPRVDGKNEPMRNLYSNEERDVAPRYSVCLWCGGSSDQSFLVDPLSYFTTCETKAVVYTILMHIKDVANRKEKSMM